MAVDNLNANFIGAQGGGFEPQRGNNGQITFTGLGNITGVRSDILTLSNKSFPVPKRSTGTITIGWLNEERHFPGRTKYDPMTVVFHDYVDQNTRQVLELWYQMVQDQVSGATGLAANIKKTALVDLYSPDLTTFDRQYQIIGAYPELFDPGEVDNDAEGEILISISLRIDKFYPLFAGISPNNNGGIPTG